jgi:predicted O-linked N-acetylglucosamine transferase (SPINDLY family)
MFSVVKKLLLAVRITASPRVHDRLLDAEALHGRGMALLDLMRNDEAIASFREALKLKPDFAEAHYKLGVALTEQGRRQEAVDAYRSALALKPDYAEAHNNLGVLLGDEGRLDAAVASYQKALVVNPALAEAHLNLGNALAGLGRPQDAVISYRNALSCRPNYVEAHVNLGSILKELDRLDEASASYSEALACRPDHAEAHNGLGGILQIQGKHGEAMACYRRAISLAPNLAEAHFNLGVVLHDQGRLQEAIESYRHALRLRPDLAEARWSLTMSTLPAVYGYGVSPSACRAEFEQAMAQLESWFIGERVAEGYRCVGRQLPFNLAYQEENNKALLSRYGGLCSRLMEEWLQRQDIPLSARQSAGRIEVGIVSSHFSNHSVWHAIVKGWLQQLDKGRFHLHLFHLGTAQDRETGYARGHAATFTEGAGSLKRWVEAICARRLDVLVYPEVGMDSMTARLASLRLAPVQACSWGHPETTGLPSIDYYLSAEDFEPEDAEAHYSERLVRLPGLGFFYAPAATQPAAPDCKALGINPAVPLLICPGIPFKYAPQHDWVLVEIARKLGKCQFIFFTPTPRELGALLRDRLNSVFTQAGLKPGDFLLTIPWQDKPAFYGLMQRAHVYLDTIGFSGFNTAMQAVECGLPMVTRAGRFMRGRFAAAILKRMDLPELVARTEEEYVALAVRLAADSEYRERIREQIRKSRSVLFGDPAPISALERFLADAASGGRT